MVLYSCQNKIFKLGINANIRIKNELKFLHMLNLNVFMPYLSYVIFINLKIINKIFPYF